MEQKAELVACPFCGNDGKGSIEDALHVSMQEHDWRDASWSVQCDKCTATMGYSDSEDEAITAWSQRATPQPAAVDGLVEAARKLIAAIDDLQSMTGAERIITGRSDADIRRTSNEAVASIRLALAQIERTEDGNG